MFAPRVVVPVVLEGEARCEFERALLKVPAPPKTLRAVGGDESGEVSFLGEGLPPRRGRV
jgi:hypothetical protein